MCVCLIVIVCICVCTCAFLNKHCNASKRYIVVNKCVKMTGFYNDIGLKWLQLKSFPFPTAGAQHFN